nr:reverse transcriptase domain-containing protein [Tanacetum cinerariifolium]
MTLELADRSITHPKGVAEDVFFKVGKFHFPTDFIVVDFKADLRFPLILGSFLRTGRALIDVYGEEITLKVNDEFVTFNLDQVMRYSDNSVKSPIEEPEYTFSMGYEHFITTLVTKLDEVVESSAKNLIPIQMSHCLNVESNFVESLSNHDTLKFDHLEEFSRALTPIHIAEEERIRKEHAEYIILMEREEIDIATNTDELLPPGFENDDSEEEIYVLEELHVDNSMSNSENELSDNEASNFVDPLFPRPPPEPPNTDVEFDFEPNSGEVILVIMNDNDELECFDPRE